MDMKKLVFLLGILVALLATPASANAQVGSLIDDLQEQLLQMQQHMIQGLRGFDNMPDSSGIFFRFDTTFQNGGNAHFFRFTPPGDSLNGSASELEEFFRSMFDFGASSGSAARPFPKDDGNAPHPDDELLPEDRLREAEQSSAGDPEKPATPPAPKPVQKKPRVDSIRI